MTGLSATSQSGRALGFPKFCAFVSTELSQSKSGLEKPLNHPRMRNYWIQDGGQWRTSVSEQLVYQFTIHNLTINSCRTWTIRHFDKVSDRNDKQPYLGKQNPDPHFALVYMKRIRFNVYVHLQPHGFRIQIWNRDLVLIFLPMRKYS